jgi:HAD superfamily hydrolase (TIGR01509 family)
MRAVIFDIDGVLLDSFEENLRFFQDLLSKAGYPPPSREQFPELFHLSMMSVLRKLLPSEEEVGRVFAMGESLDVDYPAELSKMPAHAKEVIAELKKKYLLGIVSSRIRNSIFEAPALADVKEYFDVVVCYEDTVHHKPHPEPLLFAAKQLGVEPRDVVYIGDVVNDYQAAKAAGMKFILYAERRLHQVDLCTYSFKELPRIISAL